MPPSSARRIRRLVVLAAAASCLLGSGWAVVSASSSSAAGAVSGTPSAPQPAEFLQAADVQASADRRPNILLITSDDQTLSDMRWMPHTNKLLGQAGITFTNMLSPHPLCCPARAEILTGQYAQNNGVRSNDSALLGGFHSLDGSRTIATWLTRAGYQTAFVGKYLNQYERSDGREPGWKIWNPIIANVYGYFNYTMFNNGHPKNYTNLHSADLIGMKTADYIKSMAPGARPFFIWSSQVAPHGACLPHQELHCWAPPLPARRHAHLFPRAVSPSIGDPAFNERDVSDKPVEIRRLKMRSPDEVNSEFRQRIRSLQAVDEAVARDVRALRDAGVLSNTLVLFTSDNGYLLGEHRYMSKNQPYEQALRVPLLVRGPGVGAGERRAQPVTMVDLAPTFLDYAGARANLTVDGSSFAPVLAGADRTGYDTVLIQSGPRYIGEVRYGWAYRGVRTSRYTFAHRETTGFVELYDRRLDPHELRNVAHDPRYAAIRAELDRRTRLLGTCAGDRCRLTFPPLPEPL